MRRMQVDDPVIIAPAAVMFSGERGRIVEIGHGAYARVCFEDGSEFWILKTNLMPDVDNMEPLPYNVFNERTGFR